MDELNKDLKQLQNVILEMWEVGVLIWGLGVLMLCTVKNLGITLTPPKFKY